VHHVPGASTESPFIRAELLVIIHFDFMTGGCSLRTIVERVRVIKAAVAARKTARRKHF